MYIFSALLCFVYKMAVLVSIAIIVATLLTGDLVRNLLINPRLQDDSLIKKLALDSILAIELCASSFEMGVIFQHYGLVIWTIGVFLTTVYQLSRWNGLAMPSTNTHILDWTHGSKSFMESLLRNVILVFFGLMTYRFVNCYVIFYKSYKKHSRIYDIWFKIYRMTLRKSTTRNDNSYKM